MDRFRKLIGVVLLSGVIAGFMLFVVQHFTTFPLIQKAEVYEAAAEQTSAHAHHDEEGWQPAEGTERTLYTALATILAAIGFSALLFGVVALAPVSLNWRRGAVYGILAFVCVDLAPAFGLPPEPPGAAVADLYSRQLWWVGTVLATAVALWLIVGNGGHGRSILRRLTGLVVLAVPHAIGAPVPVGQSAVPPDLMHRFAVASILTTAMFWVTLGLIGGLLYQRSRLAEQSSVDLT
jgi:cobalt transporter subunit CbtA